MPVDVVVVAEASHRRVVVSRASSLTLAALPESSTVKLSALPPLKNRTFTDAALLPLQPERIELASIGSLYVKVIVSPASMCPTVPVPFAALIETRVGATVSIVKVASGVVVVLPEPSDCVAWTV